MRGGITLIPSSPMEFRRSFSGIHIKPSRSMARHYSPLDVLTFIPEAQRPLEHEIEKFRGLLTQLENPRTACFCVDRIPLGTRNRLQKRDPHLT